MKIHGQETRTVWMQNNIIHTIEQNKLPDRFEIIEIHSLEEVCHAIRTMIIRGAPAIGAMGAFGLAQAIQSLDDPTEDRIRVVKDTLLETRPTAFDLEYGLSYVITAALEKQDPSARKLAAVRSAQEYADQSAEACRKIGKYGSRLLKQNDRILTHCNAGALATVDHGTALAPMRQANKDGKNIFVYVDETRPRLQGSKLTAFELAEEGIDHAVIVDNAAGFYMSRGEINVVITGTDRVAANGDAANKIGTYEKAVVAGANNIPVYIAAPLSTIDFSCPTGQDIPIEERDQIEVTELHGRRVAAQKSTALNPAFDVTPAEYITGFITEKGVFKPEELYSLKES